MMMMIDGDFNTPFLGGFVIAIFLLTGDCSEILTKHTVSLLW